MSNLLLDVSAAQAARAAAAASRVATVHAAHGAAVSGILWRERWLVTAAERLGERERVTVETGGGAGTAEIVALDPRTDVAVLRFDADAAVPPAWDPAEPTLGQWIALVGRERGHPAAAFGAVRIAGPAWESRRGGRIDRRIELDVRLHAASEGGAVIDAAGGLLGMAVHGPRGRVLVIPTATIARVVDTVAAHGRLPEPYLGIRLQALALDDEGRRRLSLPERARAVAVIAGVESRSPAAAAGAVPGDWVLGADGTRFPGPDGLVQYIAGRQVGDTVRLDVQRGGAETRLEVRLAERPAA